MIDTPDYDQLVTELNDPTLVLAELAEDLTAPAPRILDEETA